MEVMFSQHVEFGESGSGRISGRQPSEAGIPDGTRGTNDFETQGRW